MKKREELRTDDQKLRSNVRLSIISLIWVCLLFLVVISFDVFNSEKLLIIGFSCFLTFTALRLLRDIILLFKER